MVSNVLEVDHGELVRRITSFKTKYAGDPEWEEIRARFPKTWPI
jgi:hypothetical protein